MTENTHSTVDAVDRIQRRIDPLEYDIPERVNVDPAVQRLYDDPSADLDDPIARMAVDARRMDAVRALVEQARGEIVTLIATHRAIGPGAPPVRGAIVRGLNLLAAAEAEIVAAERGCGGEEGECTDPCHLGVTGIDIVPVAGHVHTTPS